MFLPGVPKEPSERGWGTGFSSLKKIPVVDIYLWDRVWTLFNMANLIKINRFKLFDLTVSLSLRQHLNTLIF